MSPTSLAGKIGGSQFGDGEGHMKENGLVFSQAQITVKFKFPLILTPSSPTEKIQNME